MHHHLHLWIFADYVSRLSCCRLRYLTLSKPVGPIISTHIERTLAYLLWHTQPVYDYPALRFSPDPGFSVYAYGGPGGNRTPVQNAFALKELQQYCYLTIF
jgi:hypothetical protein